MLGINRVASTKTVRCLINSLNEMSLTAVNDPSWKSDKLEFVFTPRISVNCEMSLLVTVNSLSIVVVVVSTYSISVVRNTVSAVDWPSLNVCVSASTSCVTKVEEELDVEVSLWLVSDALPIVIVDLVTPAVPKLSNAFTSAWAEPFSLIFTGSGDTSLSEDVSEVGNTFISPL